MGTSGSAGCRGASTVVKRSGGNQTSVCGLDGQ